MLVCDECKVVGKETMSYSLRIVRCDPTDHSAMSKNDEVISRGMHLCEDCAIDRKWYSREKEKCKETPEV